MGLRIARRSRSGDTTAFLDDPANRLHRLLPSSDDPSFLILNKINLYGDTLVEHPAIIELRNELARVLASIDTPADKSFMEELDALAAGCMSDECLLFIGD